SFSRDWSSDVCSSDLEQARPICDRKSSYCCNQHAFQDQQSENRRIGKDCLLPTLHRSSDAPPSIHHCFRASLPSKFLSRRQRNRSEERRVGKEWVYAC